MKKRLMKYALLISITLFFCLQAAWMSSVYFPRPRTHPHKPGLDLLRPLANDERGLNMAALSARVNDLIAQLNAIKEDPHKRAAAAITLGRLTEFREHPAAAGPLIYMAALALRDRLHAQNEDPNVRGECITAIGELGYLSELDITVENELVFSLGASMPGSVEAELAVGAFEIVRFPSAQCIEKSLQSLESHIIQYQDGDNKVSVPALRAVGNLALTNRGYNLRAHGMLYIHLETMAEISTGVSGWEDEFPDQVTIDGSGIHAVVKLPKTVPAPAIEEAMRQAVGVFRRAAASSESVQQTIQFEEASRFCNGIMKNLIGIVRYDEPLHVIAVAGSTEKSVRITAIKQLIALLESWDQLSRKDPSTRKWHMNLVAVRISQLGAALCYGRFAPLLQGDTPLHIAVLKLVEAFGQNDMFDAEKLFPLVVSENPRLAQQAGITIAKLDDRTAAPRLRELYVKEMESRPNSDLAIMLGEVFAKYPNAGLWPKRIAKRAGRARTTESQI